MDYWIWSPDMGESEAEGRTVRSVAPGCAAEAWAELIDTKGDHTLSKGGTPTIHVKGPNGDVYRYTVGAQKSMDYWCKRIVSVRPELIPQPEGST